jgi:hypothetical protein
VSPRGSTLTGAAGARHADRRIDTAMAAEKPIPEKIDHREIAIGNDGGGTGAATGSASTGAATAPPRCAQLGGSQTLDEGRVWEAEEVTESGRLSGAP